MRDEFLALRYPRKIERRKNPPFYDSKWPEEISERESKVLDSHLVVT